MERLKKIVSLGLDPRKYRDYIRFLLVRFQDPNIQR